LTYLSEFSLQACETEYKVYTLHKFVHFSNNPTVNSTGEMQYNESY